MTLYLVATPDRYGRFGHQTNSIATAILLSYACGAKILLPRYMYFCDSWNDFVNFESLSVVSSRIDHCCTIRYLESSGPDQHGNRKWDFDDSTQLGSVVRHLVTHPPNTILYLPFDQAPGLLLRLLNIPHIREEFSRLFTFPVLPTVASGTYACIHIRRGDCTPDRHPHWFVHDEFYLSLLLLLDSLLPPEFKIVICTQGDINWINRFAEKRTSLHDRLYVHSTDQLFTNDVQAEAFGLMIDATLLFTASSSFSRWASFVGSNTHLFDVTRLNHHPINKAILLHPDSSWELNESTIRKALCI